MASPIFIVSTGRSGSNMLARVLGVHSECLALHEPVPHLLPEGYARWAGSRPSEHICVSVRRKRERFIEQCHRNSLIYVESAHYCSHLIPVLRRIFDAKFVHLFRDGRDFVRSGLEQERWYNEFSWFHPQGMSLKDRAKMWLRRRFLVCLDGSFTDHRLSPPAHLHSRFEKICWLWSEINETILHDLKSLPENAKMSLRLEAFGASRIEALCDFIGLSKREADIETMLKKGRKRPNKTKEYSTPPPKKWTKQQKNRFSEIGGYMMEALGYDEMKIDQQLE